MSFVSMRATRPVLPALLVSLSVIVALVAFSGPLLELVKRWSGQEEYSHGFLIPFVAAWLLWARREALLQSIGEPSWVGPALIVIAAGLHVVGTLSALYLLSQVGFIIALMGIAASLGGISLFRVTFLPIAFLVFAIPLPYFIDAVLSWRLQLISSELGVSVIRLFNIPVYLEGNVIDLGNYKLQVVEACSGLRYLYPLLSLGFLAAYLFRAPLWQRALVFLSTIPITILMNSFRIGMVGVFVDQWGTEQAEGLLHLFEGWIIFLACAGLLVGEIYLLNRIGSRKSFFDVFAAPEVKPITASGALPLRGGLPLAACFVLICATGVLAAFVSTRQEVLPDRRAFTAFPKQLGDWNGRMSSLEPQIEHFLGLTDYILSDFSKRDGRGVNLYVAYYASQRQGLSPHSPSVCIPGNGWRITSLERINHTDEARNLTFPVNRVVVERGSSKQLLYYWFEQRGRRIANEYVSKWYLLSDALTRNRTDGALARVTTSVYPGETEADAENRLKVFVNQLMPTLEQHLPTQNDPDVRRASDPSFLNHS